MAVLSPLKSTRLGEADHRGPSKIRLLPGAFNELKFYNKDISLNNNPH
jgi:hypothetical protein